MKRLIYIQQALKVAKDKDGYGYKYRDAEQILKAAKPALEETKCAVVCRAEYMTIEGIFFKKVTAALYGEDGKEIASASDMVRAPEKMANMAPQQVSGSDTTYCKRYALQNLFAIDNGEDDIDCKTNPMNPHNQSQVKQAKAAPAAKPATKTAASPAAAKQPKTQPQQPQQKRGGMIANCQSAIDLFNTLKKIQEYPESEQMTPQRREELILELMHRAQELNCTYIDGEGFVQNEDLFQAPL